MAQEPGTDRKSERWGEIDRLFARTLDVPPAERADFLRLTCAGDAELRAAVEALLAASGEAKDFLERPVLKSSPEMGQALSIEIFSDEGAVADAGERIGRYRLIREIARGGMGTVYLAERADGVFEHRVALKRLRRGLDTDDVLARFRTERQILASLNHPNIARLLDGGATEDGRPYLVMEYVEGQPITEYCDSRSLSIEARLRLFARVADAVQYAHRNLVVHRDLKPSNILVTADGTPKLLDFGIAKIVDDAEDSEDVPRTRTGYRLLTPEYASPEQARGEPVTTATDVYQLGLLLYRLLTGHHAHRMGIVPGSMPGATPTRDPLRPSAAVTHSEAARASAAHGEEAANEPGPEALARARGTEPARLKRMLRGDLDAVVLTALRPDPEARYASAERMAEDVRHHLAGRPVRARGDTLGYRMRTFIRRHRAAVAVGAGVLLLLLAYAATVSVQARRIAHERDRAELEAAKSKEISDFVIGLFRASDPDMAKGDTVTARELLARGVDRVEMLQGQPAVRARMRSVIANVYVGLGRYDKAEPLFRQTLAHYRTQPEAARPEFLAAINNLGYLLFLRGDYAGADSLLTEALERSRRAGARQQMATTLNDLGLLRHAEGDFEQAERHHRAALALRRELFGEEHESVGNSLQNLALALRSQGDLDEAERYYRQALEVYRTRLSPDHSEVTLTRTSLAQLLIDRGEYDQAEPLLREVLRATRRRLGDEHPQYALALNELAFLLTKKGDYAAAEPLFREALDVRRKALGDHHTHVAISLNNLASVLQRQERYAEAEPLAREAVSIAREQWGASHQNTGLLLNNLADVLLKQGEYEAAEPLFRESLSILRGVLPADHRLLARPLLGLGKLLTQQGEPGQALSLLEEALTIRQQAFTDDDWQTGEARSILGAALTELGRFDEAEPLLDQGYQTLRAQRGAAHRDTRDARARLVTLYENWDRPAEAERYRTP